MIKYRKWAVATLCAVSLGALGLFASACAEGEEEVPPPELVSIIAQSVNAQTLFDLNGTFSTDGLMVVARYADGAEKPLFASDCTVAPPDLSTRGPKTVTVIYGGKSAEYNITVRELEGIEVDAGAAKTVFQIGEQFTYDGLQTVARYYDGVPASAIPTESCTVTSPDLSSFGKKPVTVGYGGKTASYEITVQPAMTAAEIVSRNNGVYLELDCAFTGIAADRIRIDLQQMNSDARLNITPEVVEEGGVTKIFANLQSAGMQPEKDYMMHLFIDGTPYDVLDLSAPANSNYSFKEGKKFFFASSKKYFSNNASLFLILRTENFQCRVGSVGLEVADGKVNLVMRGSFTGYYSQEEFSADIENVGQPKIVLNTETDVAGNSFKITADVTGKLNAGTEYIIHVLAAKVSYDVVNLNVEIQTVECGGKSYTLSEKTVFNDNPNLFVILQTN